MSAGKDHYVHDFEGIKDTLPGRNLPWLNAMRRAALARFADLGFPGPRDEDWKYTRTTAIERQPFALSGNAQVDTARLSDIAFEVPHCLVFVDGRFAPQLSRLDPLPSGVIVDSLAHALPEYGDVIEAHLGRQVRSDGHPFAALNLAYFTDGAYVHLAPHAALEAPIQLVFIATGAGHTVAHPRNLIVAGDHSSAVIIETYAGPDAGVYWENPITEVVAGHNASIRHYKLVREGAKAFHVGGTHVRQGQASRFDSHSLTLNAALARNDLEIVLNAPGAECNLDGLYLVQGRQHVDNHTRIDHATPHGTSREFYKGILDGHGRAVFNGRVIVHPGAQKTDAQQSNKNLLLSDDAEIDTKPQLEIYADDVKCTHGATVGQLDRDALFYLRSRGIDEDTARSVLTYAFASEIITRLRFAPLRQQLERGLAQRLPDSQRIKEFV